MDDIEAMQREIIAVFKGVKSRRLPLDRAKELNSTTCKMLSALKVRLKYASDRKEIPDIEYLNTKPKKRGTK